MAEFTTASEDPPSPYASGAYVHSSPDRYGGGWSPSHGPIATGLAAVVEDLAGNNCSHSPTRRCSRSCSRGRSSWSQSQSQSPSSILTTSPLRSPVSLPTYNESPSDFDFDGGQTRRTSLAMDAIIIDWGQLPDNLWLKILGNGGFDQFHQHGEFFVRVRDHIRDLGRLTCVCHFLHATVDTLVTRWLLHVPEREQRWAAAVGGGQRLPLLARVFHARCGPLFWGFVGASFTLRNVKKDPHESHSTSHTTTTEPCHSIHDVCPFGVSSKG